MKLFIRKLSDLKIKANTNKLASEKFSNLTETYKLYQLVNQPPTMQVKRVLLLDNVDPTAKTILEENNIEATLFAEKLTVDQLVQKLQVISSIFLKMHVFSVLLPCLQFFVKLSCYKKLSCLNNSSFKVFTKSTKTFIF